MFTILKLFIVLLITYFIYIIVNLLKGKKNRKGTLIVINILECSLLIGIITAINDLLNTFFKLNPYSPYKREEVSLIGYLFFFC